MLLMLNEALDVKMKYLAVFLLFLTANTVNATVGDRYLKSDAADIIANGIIIREWIVGNQINMYIANSSKYYTCSIRVENEIYGEARIWCVEVG